MAKTNQSADNRTVATDAVATIGMLIPEDAGRDAIHLATEPVVAGERLHAGQHIGFLKDGTVGTAAKELLGIVDPFLASTLFPGDRFWLVVYPRTITSLRHVWTHPSFAPAEIVAADKAEADPSPYRVPNDIDASRAWVNNWLSGADQPLETVDELIVVIEGGSVGDGDYYTVKLSDWDSNAIHSTGSDAHAHIPQELWDHMEVVMQKRIQKRPEYFSCGC
ncbi:MAG: hypothetical protein KIS86_06300 [Devosia sp.]|nr:hypothetical protein [Devosia sp.]